MELKVARYALHHWEEPCISGTRGSGTVFFSGCPLKCVYCQNHEISHGVKGFTMTVEQLANAFLRLQQQGAHNINLVTPTHFTPLIIKALDAARPDLAIPVAINCGGYESAETLRLWQDYVDIYMPDIKYMSPALSGEYSHAPDYFHHASRAVIEMARQQPRLEYDENGLLKRGLLIRHLVLPGGYEDSLNILCWIKENISSEYVISIMKQFTPTENCIHYSKINRNVTTYEYSKVLNKAIELNMKGYSQDYSKESYVPEFFDSMTE